MELNQFIFIAGGLLLFSVLMIVGGIALSRNQGKNDAERIAAEKKALRVEPPLQTGEPQIAVRPGAGDGPAAGAGPAGLEILRVTRRPVDGGLTIQTMGQAAEHIGQMTPGQVTQLKQIVREVALWVEARETPPSAGQEEGEVNLPVPDTGSAVPEPPPARAFAASLPRVPEARDMLPFRKKNIPKLEEAPETPKSIVAQIDEILQAILASSPPAGEGIRLSEDPGGGLVIVHGVRTYQAIDDVEDPAAKALIKQAVQAWNERNKLR